MGQHLPVSFHTAHRAGTGNGGILRPQLICLLGAECTGKTTLARDLANQLGAPWVPEYLRRFTALHGRTPRQDEQNHILQEQHTLEEAALQLARQRGNAWVVWGTAPLLTAVYSDCVFHDTSLYPQAWALHPRYALTLLLEPDLPWVADGLQRDGEAMRATVHTRLLQTLHQSALPFVRITGTSRQRLRTALDAVEHLASG